MSEEVTLAALSAEQFLAKIEGGEVDIDSLNHDLILRYAFVSPVWRGLGVFSGMKHLHGRAMSFGKEDLKFNRYVHSCLPPTLGRLNAHGHAMDIDHWTFSI